MPHCRVLNSSGLMPPQYRFGIKQVKLCFNIEIKRFLDFLFEYVLLKVLLSFKKVLIFQGKLPKQECC